MCALSSLKAQRVADLVAQCCASGKQLGIWLVVFDSPSCMLSQVCSKLCRNSWRLGRVSTVLLRGWQHQIRMPTQPLCRSVDPLSARSALIGLKTVFTCATKAAMPKSSWHLVYRATSLCKAMALT